MKSKRVKMMAERLFLLDPNTHMTVVVTLEGGCECRRNP